MSKSNLVLVAGYAGVGKSEFAKLLSRETGWPSFDKDVVTKPLVEKLLRDLGADVDDRYSDLYREHVYPREYQHFMEYGLAELSSNGSTILQAPFLREVRDSAWLTDLEASCVELSAQLVIIWVYASPEVMRVRIQARGYRRDEWKLANWASHVSTMDLTRPSRARFTVDNTPEGVDSSTALLRDQARAISRAITLDHSGS